MEYCLRCNETLQKSQDTVPGRIEFFACDKCESAYAKEPGQALHDRWLMPITLPLYLIMFDRDPVEKAHYVAEQIANKSDPEVQIILAHIEDELANPKQKVSQIHDLCCKDEEVVRAFLAQFSDELKKIKRQRGQAISDETDR